MQENASDAEQEKWLRRLAFPKPLEQEFHADYLRRTLPNLRLGLLALTGVFILQALLIMSRSGFDGLICLKCLIPPALWSITLLYDRYPRWLERFLQPLGVLCILFLASSIAIPSLAHHDFQPDGIAQKYLLAEMLLTLTCLYTLIRMQFVWATAVCWILTAAAEWAAYQAPPGVLQDWARDRYLILVGNAFGMLACYFMEQALRRDFLQQRTIEAERRKSENLLLSILPEPIADRLKVSRETIADSFAAVTVLFADIADFTPLSQRLTAAEIVELLNDLFCRFDDLTGQLGLEKIKTIGDSYMLVGGLPIARDDHAEVVAKMALAMRDTAVAFSRERNIPIHLRIGINSGPVVAGVIGTKRFLYDLWGDTVNTASRMESHGITDAIQITDATYQLVRESYRCEARESITVKGKGPMMTYLLIAPLSDKPQPEPGETRLNSVEPSSRHEVGYNTVSR